MARRISARAARRLYAAVLELLAASGEEAARDCVARHPELLGEAADVMLAGFLEAAREQGRADISSAVAQCREFLAALRAGRGGPGQGHPAGLPAQLSAAMAGLPGLTAGPELRQHCGLLRELLARADVRANADMRALLQSALGVCLVTLEEQASADELDEAVSALESARSAHAGAQVAEMRLQETVYLGKAYGRRAERGRAQDAEAAIGCFSEVLGFGDDPLAAASRAEAAIGLAGVYLVRRSASVADDIEQAIASCDLVLDAAPGTATAGQVASAHRLAGRAYLRRLDGQRADNVEKAIGHLKAAAVAFSTDGFPTRWKSVQCDLGTAYRERIRGSLADNLDKAIKFFMAALEPGGPVSEPWDRAAALNGLAATYAERMHGDRQHDLETAIGYYRQSAEILTEHGLSDGLAVVRQRMGYAYMKLLTGNPADNVERAIGLFEDSLAMAESAAAGDAAGDPRDRARTVHALGTARLLRRYGDRAHNVEQAIADLGEAEAAFARAGATWEVAQARLSLGEAYSARILGDRDGSIERAIGYLDLALPVFVGQGMIIEHAAALTALGNLLSEQESHGRPGRSAQSRESLQFRPADAVGCHRRAIEVLGSDPAARPDLWVMLHNNLGAAYLERRDPTRQELTAAIASFSRALADGTSFRSPVEQAQTTHNLAVAHSRRADPGDLEAAITLLETALAAFEHAGLAIYRRASGKELGDARSRLGDQWPGALRAYQIALQAADDLYVSSLQLQARESELGATPGLHLRAGYAAARAGQLDEAVTIIERGRARVTGEALARDTAVLSRIKAADQGLAGEFAAAAAAVRELEAGEMQIADENRGAGGGPLIGRTGPSPLAGWESRKRLEAAHARLADAIGQIRGLDGHAQFLAQPALADVAAIAEKAGPLAYLAVTDYGSVTLVVAPRRGQTGPGPAAALVAEPAEPLTARLLRSHLIRDESGTVTGGYLPAQLDSGPGGRALKTELDTLLPLLGDRLIGPLARHLSALRTDAVTLVPCGLLGLLPLHAATYQPDGAAERHSLLRDFAVSYAPSARVLTAAHAALLAAAAASSRPDRVLAGVADADDRHPLPYAQAELEQVTALFPVSRTASGRSATKAKLVASLPGASHVHLACHAHFDPGSPRASAIELAGEGPGSQLTLAEIIGGLSFAGIRLVTASACQTAITDFTDLPDEAIGLPAGLLQAGAAGVVGTLWPVSDLSTALLMTRFYEYLLGNHDDHATPMRPAQALRRAQLWLATITQEELQLYYGRHDSLRRAHQQHPIGMTMPTARASGRRPYGDPLHWAAFVFTGSG